MTRLFEPLHFKNGSVMKNRLALAPLTNQQSHADGTLSEDEYRWLTMRAKGGFGLTMTCASHVQETGRGFNGQLGCFSDLHLEGLGRLASGIKAEGSLSVLQLHHAGMRALADPTGERPVCPSSDEKSGARELSPPEIEQLIEDFIAAAERAAKAGFDGVELHGAHGYILCQFLSPEINRRKDRYGGSVENRARILFEIIDGIRRRCRADLLLSVRLSPERFGMKLAEIVEVAQRLCAESKIDLLDMSLWDCFKEPEEEAFRGRPLMSYFTELDRGDVRLAVAGKLQTGQDARRCLDQGADCAFIGRAAILHHDFPKQVQANAEFVPRSIPVSREYLRSQGLAGPFVKYLENWEGFVKP